MFAATTRPSVALRTAPARASTSRRPARVAASSADSETPAAAATPRRAFLRAALGVASFAAASAATPVLAKSFEEAEAEKLARKEAVRAAAQASAATGRSAAAFADSEYQLSEESKTPNFHTRQEEGLRKAGGA